MNRRALWALVRKDLTLERRGRELIPGMGVFVLASFVLFRFGLGLGTLAGGSRAAGGVLWITVVFSAMIALGRSFAAEREGRLWDGLLGAPIDRSVIWGSRVISFLVFLMAVQVVAVPVFWLFFLQTGATPSLWVLIATLILSDIGIATVGALVAGLGQAARNRELLVPVLFLPFSIPLVLTATTLTVHTITLQTSGFYVLKRLGFLGVYDTIFALLGWALFEYIVED
jgi:heme exporter protein B